MLLCFITGVVSNDDYVCMLPMCYYVLLQVWYLMMTISVCYYLVLLRFITGVVSNGGFLYVVGGDDGSSNLASVECYDPKTNLWTLLSASMMTGRSYAGVTVIDKPVL